MLQDMCSLSGCRNRQALGNEPQSAEPQSVPSLTFLVFSLHHYTLRFVPISLASTSDLSQYGSPDQSPRPPPVPVRGHSTAPSPGAGRHQGGPRAGGGSADTAGGVARRRGPGEAGAREQGPRRGGPRGQGAGGAGARGQWRCARSEGVRACQLAAHPRLLKVTPRAGSCLFPEGRGQGQVVPCCV